MIIMKHEMYLHKNMFMERRRLFVVINHEPELVLVGFCFLCLIHFIICFTDFHIWSFHDHECFVFWFLLGLLRLLKLVCFVFELLCFHFAILGKMIFTWTVVAHDYFIIIIGLRLFILNHYVLPLRVVTFRIWNSESWSFVDYCFLLGCF